MGKVVLAVWLVVGGQTASALESMIQPLALYPHPMEVTTGTLYQRRTTTDSLVLELPFRMWTRAPTPVESEIVDLECVEFNSSDLDWDSRIVWVLVWFTHDSLRRRIEEEVSFLDDEGRVVARIQHYTGPEDFLPRRNVRPVPLLGGSFSVPRSSSRLVRWEARGQKYSAQVPTSWATCRIKIRAVPHRGKDAP